MFDSLVHFKVSIQFFNVTFSALKGFINSFFNLETKTVSTSPKKLSNASCISSFVELSFANL